MILPKDGDRSWTRDMWKFFHRYGRCIDRAFRESGSLDKQMLDMLVYGRGEYTPDQLQTDAERVSQLMNGLKP